MDKFQLDIKIKKWHEAIRFLKEHKNDLDETEWIAFEALSDYWRTKREFDPLDAEEINENINLLVECDKLHPNNREIIEKSKEFRGIASQMYTNDAETFAQFRKAMQESGNIKPKTTNNNPAPRKNINPPKPQPPRIIITSVEFCGSDYNDNIEIPYGSPITTAVKYLKPKIHYRVEGDKSKKLEVSFRITDSAGNLKHADNNDYTLKEAIDPTQSKHTFPGWGNKEGTTYCAGPTKIEFLFNDEIIYTATVDIKPAWPTNPPSIIIERVTFNNSDYNRNIITPFGVNLPENSKYIQPKIEYSVKHPENRVINLGIKYIDPSGKAIISNTEKNGMTTSARLGLWQTEPLTPAGYGNNDGTFYKPGRYQVEIYEKSMRIYTTSFNVIPTVKPTSTPPPITNIYRPRTQKSWFRKNIKRIIGWVALLIVIAIAFNYCKKCVRDVTSTDSESYVQVMAEGIYLRSTPEAENTSNLIGGAPYGTKLIVTDSTADGWYKVKIKDTQEEEGYVASKYTLPQAQFEKLDRIWGSNSVKKDIDESRLRRAILDFIDRNSLNTGSSEWQIPQSDGYISQPRLKDGYDKYPEFAFLLQNNSTGQKFSAIYSFTSDGEPVLQYSKPVNTDGSIRKVSYSRKRGYKIDYTQPATEQEYSSEPIEEAMVPEAEPANAATPEDAVTEEAMTTE